MTTNTPHKSSPLINPFQDITESFFLKRTSEFNETGLNEYADELIYKYKYLHKIIEGPLNLLRNLPIIGHLIGPPFEHQEQLNKLLAHQKLATSYKEWFEVSLKLDNFLQKDQWKLQDESTLYDYKLIQKNLSQLRQLRLNKDYPTLLYLVRTTWTRNLGNMGNVNLYRHSHVGTKKLIESYIEECELILAELTSPNCPLDDRYVLSMLLQTRKLIGRTLLVLSGGGCFGLFHIGVLSNLLEMNLLPRIISGSSAGAIIASILCVQSQEETLELISNIEFRRFDIFEESANKEPFLVNLLRFLKYGTWFDNKYLQQTMFEFLGDLTFRESYNRTGRILNITVSPLTIHDQPTLLNYLTLPNVLIWSAVCASCSLPGVFPSSTIFEKTSDGLKQEWNHASVKFVDGSVDNDMPITRLSEMFNVDHIIACQCNPHVVPFLKMSVLCVGGEVENEFSAKFKNCLNKCYDLFSLEIMHYLEVSSELGICKNIATKLRSVFAQQYSGDITILPDTRLTEIGKLLANPTPKFLLDATVRGARLTWPKITLIKNHCSIEFALDKSISEIRARLISTRLGSSLPLVMSPSQLSLGHQQTEATTEDFDNYKVTSKDEKSASLRHFRHKSDSTSVGSLHLKSNYYPPLPPQTARPSVQTLRYKHSLPLMTETVVRMDRPSKSLRRRRKTVSNLTTHSDSVASRITSQVSSPDVTIQSYDLRQRYTSLPVSSNNTEPSSPFQTRKEFIGGSRMAGVSSSTSASLAQDKVSISPKKRKQHHSSLSSLNSGFFKNNQVPKVMLNPLHIEPPVDPSDDDVIIRKITGAGPTKNTPRRASVEFVRGDGVCPLEGRQASSTSKNFYLHNDDEVQEDEDDPLADGYGLSGYTVSGQSTPMR